MNSSIVVKYGSSNRRYRVEVWNVSQNKQLDEYEAGNSPHDSKAVVPEGEPGALSPQQVRQMAEQTARETAAEYHAPEPEYDEDITTALVDEDSYSDAENG